MLLRYFVNFYDMEIIEEEAFLAWKEDIAQEFPGKGKALFQVQWCQHSGFHYFIYLMPAIVLIDIRGNGSMSEPEGFFWVNELDQK